MQLPEWMAKPALSDGLLGKLTSIDVQVGASWQQMHPTSLQLHHMFQHKNLGDLNRSHHFQQCHT